MATINDRLIGSRIRSARLKAGLTQDQVANLLDMTEAYCSRVECGKSRINLSRLYDFCSVLNVHEMDILAGCCTEYSNDHLKEDDIYKAQLLSLIEQASPATLEMLVPICEAVVHQGERLEHFRR